MSRKAGNPARLRHIFFTQGSSKGDDNGKGTKGRREREQESSRTGEQEREWGIRD